MTPLKRLDFRNPHNVSTRAKRTLRSVVCLAGLGLLGATPGEAINYVATGSGNINTAIWMPTGTPGPGDTATIGNGLTVDFANLWNVDVVVIQNGGTVIGTAQHNTLQVSGLAVNPGGVLRGFDAAGGGGSMYVGPQGAAAVVQNDGLMRGGDPYGNLYVIVDGAAKGCTTTSTINSLGGSFLGGSDGGNVFMIGGSIAFLNATVEGGSGAAPFVGGQSRGGSIFITGNTIDLNGNMPGLTRVVSGSNTTMGGVAGSTAILARACPSASSLTIGLTAYVDVGTPSIGGCPEVTLFSAGTSTILGNVGSVGTTCGYWDPPDLKLSGDGRMQAKKLIVVGDTFSAAGLNGTGLEAGDSLSLTLAPGGVLDLQGLTPGVPFFKAGNSITLCADEILVDPGVSIDELMEPPPSLCPGGLLPALSLPPALHQGLQPGDTFSLRLDVMNIGNGPGDVEVMLQDTAGWLQGGVQSIGTFLAPGETVILTATLVVPAVPATDITELVLTASIAGQPAQEVVSVFILR